MGSGRKPPPEGVGPPAGTMNNTAASAASGGSKAEVGRRAPKKQQQSEMGREASQQPSAGKKAATNAAAPAQTVAETLNTPAKKAWTGAEASRALFAKAEQVKAARPVYPDEIEFAEAYEVARRKYNVLPTGRQRAPTPEELNAEFLWRTGAIHLNKLPGHFKQTRTVKQRVRALAHMRKTGYSVLYLPPPPGFKLRQHGARYQLNVTLLGMNENGDVTDPVALELLAHVNSIHITQSSIEFWFVRPEDAEKFAGKSLRLPGGTVTLLATESFTTENPDFGFDDVAMSLLYEIRLIGGDQMNLEDILAIGEHICAGMEITDFEESRNTTSSNMEVLQDTCWTLTLRTMNGPPGLANVRELVVKMGERELVFGVHQPRLAKFPPCPVCLHDWHTRQKCPHKENSPEAAARRNQLRAPRSLAIEVEEPTKFPYPPKPTSRDTYAKQVAHEYMLLEPGVARAQATVAKLAEAATAASLEATRAQAKLEATEREARAAVSERDEAMEAAAAAKVSETTASPRLEAHETKVAGGNTVETKAKRVKSKTSPTAKAQSTKSRAQPKDSGNGGEKPTDVTADAQPRSEPSTAAFSGETGASGKSDCAGETKQPGAEQNGNGGSTQAIDHPQDAACTSPTPIKGSSAIQPTETHLGTQSGEIEAQEADMEVDGEQGETSKPPGVPFPTTPIPESLFVYKPLPRSNRAGQRKAKRKAKHRALRATVAVKEATAHIRPQARPSDKRMAKRTDVDDSDFPDTDSEVEEDAAMPAEPPPTSLVDDMPVGEKRSRVDTIDDPSAPTEPVDKPPTRQARANTAQATVVSATAKALIRAKARAANARAAAEGGPPRQRQLSVAPFLQPAQVPGEHDDEPMDQDGNALEHDDLATVARALSEDEWRTITFSAFKTRLGLREIETPADGHCFHLAVHAMKAVTCAEKLIHTRAVKAEIKYWRKGIAEHLMSALTILVANGSIALADVSEAFLCTRDVDEMTMPRIIEHLRLDAAKSCSSYAGERYWGTGFHIMSLVHWCKEPVYVLSVVGATTADRAWEFVAQRYYYKPQDDGVGIETLSVAEVVAQLKIYKLKKVLPLLLVLRHMADPDGRNASHFQGLRVSEEYYTEWSGRKARAAAMKTRLTEALAIIDAGYTHTPEEYNFTPPSGPEIPETSTEYVPSPSDATSGVILAPPEPPEVIDLASPSQPIDQGPEGLQQPDVHGMDREATVEQQEEQKEQQEQEEQEEPEEPAPRPLPVGMAVSLALDASPSTLLSDISLSQTVGSAGTGSPATPVEESDLRALMERLESTLPVQHGDPTSRALTKATTANRLAYVSWRHQLPAADRLTVERYDSLVEATENLLDDGITITHIARAIPYPQVWLATMQDEDIVRIGQSLSTIATIQMLHRMATDSRMSKPAQDFCVEWATAIAVSTPPATKARLAKNLDRWTRLRHLIPKRGPRIPIDADVFGRFLTDSDWYRLITLLAALPEHLPRPFRTAPVPQLCDGLAVWLLNAFCIDYTAAVAKAVSSRDWETLSLLFADDDDDRRPASIARTAIAGHPPDAPPRAAAGGPDRN